MNVCNVSVPEERRRLAAADGQDAEMNADEEAVGSLFQMTDLF